MATQRKATTTTKGNTKGNAKAQAQAPVETSTAMVPVSPATTGVEATGAPIADNGGDVPAHTVHVGVNSYALTCTTLAALRETWQAAFVPADAGKAEPLAGKQSSAKPKACYQLVSESGHNRQQNCGLWGGKGAGAGHLRNWASGLARWLNGRPHMLPDGYRAAVATGNVEVADTENGGTRNVPSVHVALVNDAQA